MEYEDTALHEAVRFGDIEEVKKSLESGESPNAIGFYRWSAVHEGVSVDDTDILSLLLTHGGNPNVADDCDGSTPLHMAAKLDQIESLKVLLKHGACTTVKNKDDQTPVAVATGSCKEYLLKFGENEGRDKRSIYKASSVEKPSSPPPSAASSTTSSQDGNSPHISPTCKLQSYRNSYKNRSNDSLPKHNSSEHIAGLIVPKLGSLGNLSDKESLRRPQSLLSVRSTTSVDSVLTTKSHPERGAAAQRTTRKPVGASSTFVSKAPGLRLSVEYSEETKMLKVRAWSIQYVTLPSATATISSSIHVRSCIFPGNKIWSKTEDIPIHKYLPPSDAECGTRNKTPSFDEPITLQKIPVDRKMCFKTISESDLSEKNLEIALCCKTPTTISSKVHYIAKLFLKCNEAVNVVMPKWFLMTSCSIEKTPRTRAVEPSCGDGARAMVSRASTTSYSSVTSSLDGGLSSRDETHFRNPTFELTPPPPPNGHLDPPNLSRKSDEQRKSVTSVSHVQITDPIPAEPPPPINKLSSSIGIRNPFRKEKGGVNLARAAVAPLSRDKALETRIEMGEMDKHAGVTDREKHRKPSIKQSARLEDLV